ncbi:hypothetical protein, variant 2, partial [Phytophthora nicotianae]|uniref:BZIP domain-containing protein n=2 Tax=Phytophthora nicotianae TaxID=4792 RepID=V9EZP8_PHYNI
MNEHREVVEAAFSFIDEFTGDLSMGVPSFTDSVTSASSAASLDELLGFDYEEETPLLPLSDDAVPAMTLNVQTTQTRLATSLDSSKTTQATRSRQKKRQGTYNPNHAREQQRKELRALRTEAADLETQVAAMRQVRRAVVIQDENNSSHAKQSPFADIARTVWRAAAQQQISERMKATRENRRLKGLVASNADIISKLQALLHQCSLDKRSSSMHPKAIEYLRAYDAEIFTQATLNQLIASTDASYQQVDKVFSRCCVDLTAPSSCTVPEMLINGTGHVFSRVFGTKVFPFPTKQTGRAVWDVVSKRVRPSARCHFNHIVHSTFDTIVESCGTELYTDDSKTVVFHTRQAKRYFKEETRDVIVWQSNVRPVLFGGKFLQGAAFRETGFFLIHHHPLIPSEFALLQTCYVITPHTPMPELPTDPLAREVTDFVLKCMAESIPENHKVFENALFGQELPFLDRNLNRVIAARRSVR